MRRSLVALLLTLAVSPLFAKSLHWRTFDVTARLDADGRLHVREQQGIVFDGDWNGGERIFNIRPGQSLSIEHVYRVEDGHDVPMTQGDLSKVDHWDYAGANTIRWRSRLPSEAPFNNLEITYAIEYVLSGILEQIGNGVQLSHDFAFPNRDGVIENFSLRFDLDPAWRGLPSPYAIQRQNIPPGQGVVVNANLAYTGSGSPPGIRETTSPTQAAIVISLLLIAGLALTWKFYIDEKHKGRFAPLAAAATVNDIWLERNVFNVPPEAVGYAWDESTGAPEVGAVLARMEQEKKITTWTTEEESLFAQQPVLHMKLNVGWETLPDGEKELVQALFLGQRETDTTKIRDYYRSAGFQPQKLLKPLIDAELAKVPEWNLPAKPVTVAEILLIILALIAGWMSSQVSRDLGFLLVLATGISIIAIPAAVVARRRVDRSPLAPILFTVSIIGVACVTCFAAIGADVTIFGTAEIAIAATLIAAAILFISRSREDVHKIAFRRRLAAARAYFATQLREKNPSLRDAWYPYLIALGLGPNVDKWFKEFSAASTALSTASALSSSSLGSSSSSSTSSWTGGGGAFGGAGASGSWAAMSTVASGVAAPGSSGGGGGGGGGGSSGGGGGGGW